MNIPEGLAGKELHKFLKENKSMMIASKKAAIKYADAVSIKENMFVSPDGVLKEFTGSVEDTGKLTATVIINTTNILDSHSDVHVNGIWKKSLKESKDFYHIQEHKMQFDKIIADSGVKAFTKSYSWRELGYDMDGTTEALVFVSPIDKARNEFMYQQYRKGYVRNHSVGMRYVKIEMCINEPDDKWYREEFEAWEKYIDNIVNKEAAIEQGYFWAVTEAKIVEGSAVVRGSNWITPTQNIEAKSTDGQPAPTTENQPQKFDFMEALQKTTFIKN